MLEEDVKVLHLGPRLLAKYIVWNILLPVHHNILCICLLVPAISSTWAAWLEPFSFESTNMWLALEEGKANAQYHVIIYSITTKTRPGLSSKWLTDLFLIGGVSHAFGAFPASRSTRYMSWGPFSVRLEREMGPQLFHQSIIEIFPFHIVHISLW